VAAERAAIILIEQAEADLNDLMQPRHAGQTTVSPVASESETEPETAV
jgi:hypothetical protein